ncbi:hypothetical protein CPC08DRAFT_716825 [Agrocybe pediades]|nr:hypothetical protein CPC08DRAFT_716825 [Agrocybe pediades]
MYSKVIALRTKILGDDHPSTLTSRNNLGSLYAQQGQWEKAEVILVPVVEARTRVLGNNHKHTLTTCKWLEIVQQSRIASESNDNAKGIEDSSNPQLALTTMTMTQGEGDINDTSAHEEAEREE